MTKETLGNPAEDEVPIEGANGVGPDELVGNSSDDEDIPIGSEPVEEPASDGPGSSGSSGSNKKPKKSLLPILVGVLAIAVAVFCGYYFLYHDWGPATCTEPETCRICGCTQGEPLGHEWDDAACTKPKACSRCGVTEGEALGHEWEDATCTTPKTCERCGETQGDPLGHDVTVWVTDKEASCTEKGSRSGTCNRCGQIVAEELPLTEHTPGDWQVTQDITLSTYGEIKPGVESRLCTVCGKVLETRDYTVEVSTQLANACKQAMQTIRTSHPSYQGLIQELYEYEGFTEDEATFAADHCGADWNEQAKLRAEDMMHYQGYSRSGLIDWLVTYELFTSDQANYAADQVGL